MRSYFAASILPGMAFGRVDRFIHRRGVDQRAACRGVDLGGNPMVGGQYP